MKISEQRNKQNDFVYACKTGDPVRVLENVFTDLQIEKKNYLIILKFLNKIIHGFQQKFMIVEYPRSKSKNADDLESQ